MFQYLHLIVPDKLITNESVHNDSFHGNDINIRFVSNNQLQLATAVLEITFLILVQMTSFHQKVGMNCVTEKRRICLQKHHWQQVKKFL